MSELPDGYAEDSVFEIAIKSTADVSGYSSDDGGTFSPSPAVIRTLSVGDSSSISEDTKEKDAYFELHQEGQWNERFQELVESAYFKRRENNYSAVRQYELSIELRQLCVAFAQEAASIGVEIVKQMVCSI